MNLRFISARIINSVTQGQSLSDSLETTLTSIKDARDKAFVQALCYGVCRFYTRLDVILSHLLKKPLKSRDSDLHALLLIGLYQLTEMRIPDYAAVTETVNATEMMKKVWARGFANAVLREFLRRRNELEEKIKSDPEAYYAHPEWWIRKIKAAWPQEADAIFAANNQQPPLSLRVNQQKINRDEYLKKLHEHGIAATIIPATSAGLTLDSAMNVDDLPGFKQGEVSVQDGAAQLAGPLLHLLTKQTVLDACAAPGGKLCQLAEIEPQLHCLVAVEKEEKRIPAIKDNLKRLQLQAKVICSDASETTKWWDDQLFDRILLDAPCSASGVIRRHPDIKLLRQETDLVAFSQTQQRLLTALWPLLKPEGYLLYATCSLFPEENSHVIQEFIAKEATAIAEPIPASWGVPLEVGRQILPGMENMDGFYYALLKKTSC